MGAKTKIDWADATWNPVTGCLHGCEYCFARRIALRYGGADIDPVGESSVKGSCNGADIFELKHQLPRVDEKGIVRVAPYPYWFTPTFHRYRLDIPKRWTKPRNIFVCSMADLFGEWVPDEWIAEVFKACEAAPQHRYLFLTKNPARYIQLAEKGILPDGADNMWFGSTVTKPDTDYFYSGRHNTFVSVEPILKPFIDLCGEGVRACESMDWIIIGAETGNRKDKVIPKASWIMALVRSAEETSTPIFMKDSLRHIMCDDFRQEFPW